MISGVPIRNVAEDWCRANQFKKELFPSGLLDESLEDSLDGTGTSFAVSLSPGNSPPLEASLGIYETCQGKRGTFLIIVDESRGAARRPVFLEQWDTAAFAVLRKVS